MPVPLRLGPARRGGHGAPRHHRPPQLEQMRTEFVANFSHEAPDPAPAIQVISNAARGAMDDPAHARRFLEVVFRHTERLGRLLNDLTDLSNIGSAGCRYITDRWRSARWWRARSTSSAPSHRGRGGAGDAAAADCSGGGGSRPARPDPHQSRGQCREYTQPGGRVGGGGDAGEGLVEVVVSYRAASRPPTFLASRAFLQRDRRARASSAAPGSVSPS